MLRRGQGRAIESEEGLVVATALSLPYGPDCAWVSMVLVDPDWRRRGLATQLMEQVVADVEQTGRTALLDATPAGREVYRQIGFRDTWGFSRWKVPLRAAAFPEAGADVRALREPDWPAVAALDLRAFGADRLELLRHLAGRMPATALVSAREGRICGFALGRDGVNIPQVGPVVSERDEDGEALLLAALGRLGAADAAYVDLLDRHRGLAERLERLGGARERPFTRMVRGRDRGFDQPGMLVAVAGPELG
ncbi:MAG: GNAT family N-acetyltransferase [Alphaproteobacteria bacterium]|nr:GNAT family N-acetyltransferase [Alphaproteobacteria bacterium]